MSSTPESAISRTADDVRRDPRVGDVVRAVITEEFRMRGMRSSVAATVRAISGDLIATTENGDGAARVSWDLRSDWCYTKPWIKEWEVLHIAGEQP